MSILYTDDDGSLAARSAQWWTKKDHEELGLLDLRGPSLDVATAMEALLEDPNYYGGAFAALIKASAKKLGDEVTIRRLLLALRNSFDDALIDKVMTEIDGPKEANG